MPLTAGTRVGSFIIQSPIGAGGMGEVYLAEDARLRRRVALKVIQSHLARRWWMATPTSGVSNFRTASPSRSRRAV